jgi:hypothetical protein
MEYVILPFVRLCVNEKRSGLFVSGPSQRAAKPGTKASMASWKIALLTGWSRTSVLRQVTDTTGFSLCGTRIGLNHSVYRDVGTFSGGPDLCSERLSRPAKMSSTTCRNLSGSSGEAWKSHRTCFSPMRSRDRIGAGQLPRNVLIKCNLSFSGIECPSTNRSNPSFWQSSTASLNPRADVTLYPFCSNSIWRVASRTESYETESIRLGIVTTAAILSCWNRICQWHFF